MFNRIRQRKVDLTLEQIERKKEAERLRQEAHKELEEAQEIARALREIRIRNHFGDGFRKALGG